MNEPIVVRPLPRNKGSDSLSEAIQFSKDLQESPQLVKLNNDLSGKVVASLTFGTLHQACFTFADKSQLQVASNPKGLTWKLENSPQTTATSQLLGIEESNEIALNFGSPVGIVHWEIEKLSQSLAGCTMRKLHKSDIGLFVYLSGKQPLLFTPLATPESPKTNGTLLYFDYAN